MMFDEFVQRIELYDPQEIFARAVSEHFKMLYAVAESVGTRKMHIKNIVTISFIPKGLCNVISPPKIIRYNYGSAWAGPGLTWQKILLENRPKIILYEY